jgi:hypothetical protein
VPASNRFEIDAMAWRTGLNVPPSDAGGSSDALTILERMSFTSLRFTLRVAVRGRSPS